MKYKNFMSFAIDEAKIANNTDNVPVGAIVVKDGKIISKAHNDSDNVLKHAEILAINDALNILGSKYLDDCDLYVTLEPCAMCSGAIINSRIKRVYIGAMDEKNGCCGSIINLLTLAKPNIEVYHGICETECASILKNFFKQKR